MDWTNRTRQTELGLAWVVATGVALAGSYDFWQGQAPQGVLDVSSSTRLVLFLASCVLAALAATALTIVTNDRSLQSFRGLLVLLSLMPAVLADPTYASLLLALPLIDLRRRHGEPTRSVGTIAILGFVAWMVLTEDTPRVVAEVEAMFGLCISFFIIVMFGDALRQLDQGVIAETELAQLTERNRLATDLHDSVGHHLLASSIQLQKAKALQLRDPSESAQAVEYASQAVAEAISETRILVETSRANQSLQFEAAVRGLVKRVLPASTAITIRMDGDYDNVSASTHVAVYRVIQEALSNLVRHANATSAQLSTSINDAQLRIEVADNGTGFRVPPDSAPGGISNMRKRIEDLGGTFAVSSSSGTTSVSAVVPL